jgi:hypothetical protein
MAKRGMFALIEREHCYSYMRRLHGACQLHHTPAIVSSVTRAGIAREVRLAGAVVAAEATRLAPHHGR